LSNDPPTMVVPDENDESAPSLATRARSATSAVKGRDSEGKGSDFEARSAASSCC